MTGDLGRWESAEAFQSFGEKLMPIIAEVGLPQTEPHIVQLHNFVASSTGDAGVQPVEGAKRRGRMPREPAELRLALALRHALLGLVAEVRRLCGRHAMLGILD